jgi:energy-converting hydrogenase A subunit M
MGSCGNGRRRHPVGFFTKCSFRPLARFVKAASEEMRQPSSGLHMIEGRIERAEPHCLRQVLDGDIRLTNKVSE